MPLVPPATSPRAFEIRRIGVIRSPLQSLEGAPCQGEEGAPDVWLEVDADYAPALSGVAVGDILIVVTWLHLAKRDVLEVHPRGDRRNPLTGVFATRSPHRPNPLGLHRVAVREVLGTRLRVGPLEALDGTPVVDIKIALEHS
jgi:tRNA-Thr(GGU) m(6)t(6)A37 methyltransferase TsaA